jgi:predicted nucleic acid-binding protein
MSVSLHVRDLPDQVYQTLRLRAAARGMRLWQHDALYVVLARRLDALLVTMDARLARVPGLDIHVKVVDVSR